MGGLSRDEQAEEAARRMIDYYRELEMVVALLVAAHGEHHEGGVRYFLNDEDAWRLRRDIATVEPVVIMIHDPAAGRYVIDVL